MADPILYAYEHGKNNCKDDKCDCDVGQCTGTCDCDLSWDSMCDCDADNCKGRCDCDTSEQGRDMAQCDINYSIDPEKTQERILDKANKCMNKTDCALDGQ
eukprot:UC4_evm1s1017